MANADNQEDQNKNQAISNDADNAYNQYIDPDYQKKQKKKKIMLFAALAVAALGIVLAAVVLSLSSSSNNNAVNGPVDIVEICEAEECFEENFSLCHPARYAAADLDGTAEYEVTGVQEVGCIVSMKYTDSENQELIGKEMKCDFDNEVPFDESLGLIKEYPEDYECEGELVVYL